MFSDLLEIRPGMTALVGSGGKTSLMLCLARELRRKGTVIVTTSTKIYPPEGMERLSGREKDRLRRTLQRDGVLCVGTPVEGGKLSAPEGELSELAALADYVLIEADGAAGKPMKAHLPTEPVIPAGCSRRITVLGLSGLGRAVSYAAHRPERYAALAECGCEDPITPERAARVLRREGLATEIFMNQSDALSSAAAAEELAAKLSAPVWLGSLKEGTIRCLC